MAMLMAVRAWMLVLSFIFDFAFMWAFRHLPAIQRWGALAFMSSSWLAIVYYVRPFSNTAELWAALALLAVASHAPHQASKFHPQTWRVALQLGGLIGCVTAVGVFVRFTAAILATGVAIGIGVRFFPLTAAAHAHATRRPASGLASWGSTFSFVGGGAVAFLATCTALATVDTWLFTGKWPSHAAESWVLGPLNSALYNMDGNNTASHGRHPYSQHTAVFMPAIFSLLAAVLYWNVLAFIARGCRVAQLSSSPAAPKPGAPATVPDTPQPLPPALRDACGVCIVVFLGTLSCAPHAEERFLLPLLLPLSLLFWNTILPASASSTSSTSPAQSMQPQVLVRFTWVTCLWVFFNIVPGVLYSSLHQGGLIQLAHAARTTPLALGATPNTPHTAASGPPFRVLLTFNTLMLPQFALGQSQGPACASAVPRWFQNSPQFVQHANNSQQGPRVALMDMHSSETDLQCTLSDLLRRACDEGSPASQPLDLGPDPTRLPKGRAADIWVSTPHNTVPLLLKHVSQASAARPAHCRPSAAVAVAEGSDPSDSSITARCEVLDLRFKWTAQRSEAWHFAAEPPLQVNFENGVAAAAASVYSQMQLVTHSLQIVQHIPVQPSSDATDAANVHVAATGDVS